MSSAESGREQRPRRPRLVRTRRGRLIGGVCSGLGAHFDVDPILFRIVFVGLAFFSGVGIALYLAILLLVPEEGASRAPIWLSRSSWLSVLGVVVVVVAAGIALHAAGHAGHRGAWGFGVGIGSLVLVGSIAALVWLRLRRPAGEQGHASADRRLFGCLALVTAIAVWSVLFAVAGAWLAGIDGSLAAWVVVAIGAALVLSAFTGRARRLVVPAVAFAVSVAVIAAAHVDLHGGLGERTYRPHALSDVRHDYQLGAGRLEVDLREVAFPPGDTYMHVRLGVGEIVVLVPRGVCVATSAQIGGGYVGALEQRSGGLDVDWSEHPSPPPHTPRLVLNGDVGLGALLVADHPIERGWNGGDAWSGWFGAHSHPGELGTNEACDSPAGASR
ncbi:MAG TPA: PspC domain-containing protein [Solirubrobacteraceae bacterium]|nr:PspC domain-containing protein [Solirubrobacteraceae bacterium]